MRSNHHHPNSRKEPMSTKTDHTEYLGVKLVDTTNPLPEMEREGSLSLE